MTLASAIRDADPAIPLEFAKKKKMTAEEWYRKFYETYKAYSKNHQKQVKSALTSDRKWSSLMEDVLLTMAKALSYKHSGTLRGAPGIDIHWKKTGSTIAIEHENRSVNIHIEIANLCQDNSDLKVLITYAADEDFLPNALRIANLCARELTTSSFGKGEFLLVLGGTEYDWEGFSFRFRAEPVPLKVGGIRVV